MGIYRVPVDLTWNGSGSPGVNVFHIDTGAGVGATDVPAIVALLRDFYEDISVDLGGPLTCRFAGEVIDVENDVRLPVPTWTFTSASTNQYAAFPLALVVSWRTISATRSGTGRTFIGPLAAAVDGSTGVPPLATVTRISQAANTLLEAVATATGPDGARLAVYSRQDNIARAITGARMRTQFSILRSRRD